MEEELERDMTPRLIEDLGMRFMTEKSSRKYRYGLYECQYCNKEFEAQSNNIKHGLKSCGCQRKGINKTHGISQNKFYNTWCSMKHRCYNIKREDYKYYGARGITVCEEWLNVSNFVAWCDLTYPNIEDATLDRISNDKGYSPENCTWSDKTAQVLNRRIMKNNKSGYVGVIWHIRDKKWRANIRINKILKQIGSFKTLEEAVQTRDNYIIENNLPHKLSKDYKKE